MSLAISLAFFISGHGYATYRKTLGRGLRLGIVSEKPYLEVVDLQPWPQVLENFALRAFCPSPPLCNVDLTLFM